MSTEILSSEAMPDLAAETSCSERRLAANRANAQLSTGPRTAQGKAVSSLNAVKTGLCGRAVLLADEEEARAYREHIERVTAWWCPANCEEHALVQSMADTQWRLESIPGLESALYAQARLQGTPLMQHPDPAVQRMLLNGQAEVAEGKALKNLRLHERRLRRQMEQDKAELTQLRNERFEQEEQQEQANLAQQQEKDKREREEAKRRRREEQARLRRERRQEQLAAQTVEKESSSVLLDTNGFEFTVSENTPQMETKPLVGQPKNPGAPILQYHPGEPDSSC